MKSRHKNKEQELPEMGFVCLYRSLEKKGFYSDSEYVHLWVHLLLSASWQEKEFLFDGTLRKLKPGQFIVGRMKLAKATGINRSKIERILKVFANENMIEQQTTNKFRIISIINWDLYQNVSNRFLRKSQKVDPLAPKMTKSEHQNEQQNVGENETISSGCATLAEQSEQHFEQQVSNKRATSEQQVSTINKENKGNKDNKNPIHKKVFLEAVELSTAEEEKLRQRFGSDFDRAIDILNNYKMATGKKYKSDYHAIVGWVAKRIEEDNRKGGSRIAE